MVRRFGDSVAVPGNAVAALELVPKQQLDAAVAGPAIVAATVASSTTYTPDAATSSRFNLTINGQNVVIGIPSGGVDTQVLHILMTAITSTRTVQVAPTMWGGPDVPTHVSMQAGEEAYLRLRRTDLPGSAMWIVEEFSLLKLVARPLAYLGCSNWGQGSTATGPLSYPEDLRPGDLLYAVIHSRVSTTALPAVTNWTSVYASAIGSGTDAADTGPTRMTILKRVVGTGGVSGTQTFTALGTTAVSAVIHAFRPRPDLTITEEFAKLDVASSLMITGTGGVLTLQAEDWLLTGVGTPSDTADRIDITTMNISGVFFSEIQKRPAAAAINVNGNQISAATFVNKIIGGSVAATGITYDGSIQTPARTKGVVTMKLRAA